MILNEVDDYHTIVKTVTSDSLSEMKSNDEDFAVHRRDRL